MKEKLICDKIPQSANKKKNKIYIKNNNTCKVNNSTLIKTKRQYI